MIPVILEQLIHEGKAEFKCFAAGGSQKSILNIQQNAYIIITNVTYSPTLEGTAQVQLNIISEEKTNFLIFRNSTRPIDDNKGFAPQTSINTYFHHKNSVQFCFSDCPNFETFDVGLFDNTSIGFYPVLDYGKDPIPKSANFLTRAAKITVGSDSYKINFQGNTTPAGDFNGLCFPMVGLSGYSEKIENTPLAMIQYVEVFEAEKFKR